MTTRRLTYAQSISEALVQGMQADPSVFVFGLGVDDYKGIFGTTRPAFERFGAGRVFDVPASENALTGIAIGAALNGKRPVLVHARNDFMFLALDQLINNAAKWKYSYNGRSSVPFVTRGIIGKGWGQGPTHSQSIQSVLAHFPGLIVTMPSTPYDIKGILLQALLTDAPVVVLEHRRLYDIEGDVPEEMYTVEFGKARVAAEGNDVTIVATSVMVPEALKARELLAEEGIGIEVIDPVTIQPLDKQTILDSVTKTGRLVVLDTSWDSCGFASYVAAVVADEGFAHLRAPIKRVTPPPCPCPVSQTLEDAFYPDIQDVISAVHAVTQRQAGDYRQHKQQDAFIGPY